MFSHILLPTYFSDQARRALDFLTHMAERFGSKLSVVHMSEHQSLDSEIRLRGFRELAGDPEPWKGNLEF